MRQEGEAIIYRAIGVVRSPHVDPAKTPIQPVYASGTEGRVEVDPVFEQGLSDLEGFSHIVLLYHFHRSGGARLRVVPFLDDKPRGVFATRSPSRPNPIGLSVVRLLRREGRTLHVRDVDILDGTPLLDIKPYIGRFDVEGEVRCGWQETIDEETARRRGGRAGGDEHPLGGGAPSTRWLRRDRAAGGGARDVHQQDVASHHSWRGTGGRRHRRPRWADA